MSMPNTTSKRTKKALSDKRNSSDEELSENEQIRTKLNKMNLTSNLDAFDTFLEDLGFESDNHASNLAKDVSNSRTTSTSDDDDVSISSDESDEEPAFSPKKLPKRSLLPHHSGDLEKLLKVRAPKEILTTAYNFKKARDDDRRAEPIPELKSPKIRSPKPNVKRRDESSRSRSISTGRPRSLDRSRRRRDPLSPSEDGSNTHRRASASPRGRRSSSTTRRRSLSARPRRSLSSTRPRRDDLSSSDHRRRRPRRDDEQHRLANSESDLQAAASAALRRQGSRRALRGSRHSSATNDGPLSPPSKHSPRSPRRHCSSETSTRSSLRRSNGSANSLGSTSRRASRKKDGLEGLYSPESATRPKASRKALKSKGGKRDIDDLVLSLHQEHRGGSSMSDSAGFNANWEVFSASFSG